MMPITCNNNQSEPCAYPFPILLLFITFLSIVIPPHPQPKILDEHLEQGVVEFQAILTLLVLPQEILQGLIIGWGFLP